MADQKVSALAELTTGTAHEDYIHVIDDTNGTPVNKKLKVGNLFGKVPANTIINGTLEANTNRGIIIGSANTPSSNTANGQVGTIVFSTTHLYVCTSTNVWKRVALSVFTSLIMELTESNLILYAAKYYDNPHCEGVDEFHDDVNRIKYLLRLLKKLQNGEDINVQLILNHLVVLYNVFEVEPLTEILLFKLKDYETVLFPFLIYLGYLDAKKVDIVLNIDIINQLRKI